MSPRIEAYWEYDIDMWCNTLFLAGEIPDICYKPGRGVTELHLNLGYGLRSIYIIVCDVTEFQVFPFKIPVDHMPTCNIVRLTKDRLLLLLARYVTIYGVEASMFQENWMPTNTFVLWQIVL